jgi:gluconolactonase
MMNLFAPPAVIRAEVFSRMPDALRRPKRSQWGDFNKAGQPVDCFIEGPSFDADGQLVVTDIPHGRIFKVSSSGSWTPIAEYDGWPNGLKFHADGRAFITDYKRGIMTLDMANGKVAPLIETMRSESFKGVNDLHFAANGDLYFTDQGQTGLHDPTGRVYRYTAAGQLACLVNTIPSPNGLVLDLHERVLYVAVTRGNAVWRIPLMIDGGVSKVGLAIQLSGGLGGPDGMALDAEGGLIVAHIGLGVWRFDHLGRPTHFIEPPVGHFVTNIAFKGRQLFMTESETGHILVADLPYPGKPMYGPKARS